MVKAILFIGLDNTYLIVLSIFQCTLQDSSSVEQQSTLFTSDDSHSHSVMSKSNVLSSKTTTQSMNSTLTSFSSNPPFGSSIMNSKIGSQKPTTKFTTAHTSPSSKYKRKRPVLIMVAYEFTLNNNKRASTTTTTSGPPYELCTSGSTVLYDNQFIFALNGAYAAGMKNNYFGVYYASGNTVDAALWTAPQTSAPSDAWFVAKGDRNLAV
ncbi:unnamed protein product [Didymodactylos carnosus]|uniref:Uncharacterized protein n=1 Tax=Didymodactylos carnosus TaxID=1234261 RepID=A0A814NUP1_9BILA|nr:unnamed protein product [Didymodactylos carnosus]CAF3862392.1 unnamed protein product [Didymodactylos carnosus]